MGQRGLAHEPLTHHFCPLSNDNPRQLLVMGYPYCGGKKQKYASANLRMSLARGWPYKQKNEKKKTDTVLQAEPDWGGLTDVSVAITRNLRKWRRFCLPPECLKGRPPDGCSECLLGVNQEPFEFLSGIGNQRRCCHLP